ncbi:unnamed protein product, partial [Gulo gulo]
EDTGFGPGRRGKGTVWTAKAARYRSTSIKQYVVFTGILLGQGSGEHLSLESFSQSERPVL